MLLIDDHRLFADGLSGILEQAYGSIDFTHTYSLDEGENLLSCCFDIVLVDIYQPALIDFQRIVQLKRETQVTKFLLLSDIEDKELIIHTISAGLDGYIPKSIGKELFLGALNLVLSGGVYIPKIAVAGDTPPITQTEGARNTPRGKTAERTVNDNVLTKRQRDILKLLENGLSNKGIARELSISDGTVRIHISTIYRVLNVQNRVQAVMKSKELSYI